MTYIHEGLRKEVTERARGHCEYCGLSENDSFFTHEIDHIYAEKHGGDTHQSNLCLACADCNRHKGSDLCSLDPQVGDIVRLFHPRTDDWREHFSLNLDTGSIEPLTAIGRVTERVLKFNRPDIVQERGRLIRLGRYLDSMP